TNGLAGYWAFEAGSGMSAPDSSGNGLTGTLMGSTLPAWVTPGKVGAAALNFPGGNSQVSVGNPSSLQFTGALTLAAWALPESVTAGGRIITKGGNSGFRGFSLNVENPSGGFWRMQVPVNSTTLVSVNLTGVVLNAWMHIAGVY